MDLHSWAEERQAKIEKTDKALEEIWGVWAIPVTLALILYSIPYMFIEMITTEKKK